MRLLTFCTWLTVIFLATLQSSDAEHTPLKVRDGQLVKRSRSKCGPNLDTDTISTSRLNGQKIGIIEIQRNGSDVSRRMELPGRRIGVFYGRELPKLSKVIVPEMRGLHATDMSTAVKQKFSNVKKPRQWSTGLEGMSGCTSLFVISRKGVYATHWWENVSFSPDKEWRDPPTQTNAELFQTTVIDMLITGTKAHPGLDAAALEDDFIKAYLIHPTQTSEEAGPDDKGYTDQWNEIIKTVGDIIPTLKDQSRWTDAAYVALDKRDDRLGGSSNAEGRVLFKYDPAHVLDEKTQKTTRKAMLWVDVNRTPLHDDEW